MIDRKTLLKNFSIGFLPLLIFIVADELFGLTVGLAVAVGFGILELCLSYLRSKRIDKFVLFDTGLIIVLGFISLILQNDIFFKIKPGLIGIILVLLLGITSFSQNPILIKMSGRYMQGMQLSAEQLGVMQKMMRRLFFLFSFHTILVFYSAFYMSKEAWAFISGGLFYLLIGGMAGFEFLQALFQRWRLQKKYSLEEWFDLVDPAGKVIGRAPRSAVHGNPELLHPVIHVHIFNAQGDIFLQKRSENKDIQPGKWDTAIGGHIASGETIEHALHREAEEELGISLAHFQPLFRYVHRSEIESELVHGFLLQEEGPFYPNRQEISEARFWTVNEIKDSIGKKVFTPNFEKEFELLLKIFSRENTPFSKSKQK
jgi:isopentenyldiphosphate isomerase/intracellular septation protein A